VPQPGGGLLLSPASAAPGLLLLSASCSLEEAVELLGKRLTAMPALAAGGVLHFEGGRLHARFLSRE